VLQVLRLLSATFSSRSIALNNYQIRQGYRPKAYPCLFNIIYMNFKTLSILAVSAFVCALCACEHPADNGDDPVKAGNVTVSPTDIKVASDAVEVRLDVTSDCDWGISADDNTWVSVSPSGGISGQTSVKVKIAENATGEVRETALTVRYGTSKLSVPVRQNYDVVSVEVSDAAFMSYLIGAYDVDEDGVLSTKEAAAVTEIKASGCGIKAMPELNTLFKNITYLDCSDNELTELDISQLLGLKTMNATGNPLTVIYVWSGFTEPDGFSKPASASYVEPEINTPAGYRLVWQEEFNESATGLPDTKKWWYETAEPGWVNNELQTYIAGRKGDIVTADVSDGSLKIRAIKDGNRVYSARVNTNESWTYGWFEARLKLPKGKGTWPAFWMMPATWSGWPDGGEIDIMEHVGCVPTEVSSSIHCKAYYHAINTQKTAARKIASVMDEFHVYALEWTPEYIRTYVDGELLFHYNPDDYPKGRNADTWPFNKPFQLKLNLAWGGDWGGMYGVDESCLPATYEIDYVRVFQIPE